jgi:hypothetical protein
MLLVRAVRQTVKDDKQFWALPFKELFWKVGMTRTTPASDWNGDFLMSGQTYSTARDFARFGLLYLNDGMWNGKRILPAGWAKFVATPISVQPAGSGPRYGGQFWIYGGIDGLASDAYSPGGGQGQYAMIVRMCWRQCNRRASRTVDRCIACRPLLQGARVFDAYSDSRFLLSINDRLRGLDNTQASTQEHQQQTTADRKQQPCTVSDEHLDIGKRVPCQQRNDHEHEHDNRHSEQVGLCRAAPLTYSHLNE